MSMHYIWPPEGPVGIDRKLNIIVFSDGFQAHRQEAFLWAVKALADRLAKTAPLSWHMDMISVTGCWEPSQESLRHFQDSTRCEWRPQGPVANSADNDRPSAYHTAFGSLFCRSMAEGVLIERSLHSDAAGTQRLFDLIDASVFRDATTAPLVLVDNEQAAGGERPPGDIAWFSMQGDWIATAIHELGHSAFGLADEYDYEGPLVYQGNEGFTDPNTTTFSRREDLLAQWRVHDKPSLLKWYHLMPADMPVVRNTSGERLAGPPERQLPAPGYPRDTVGLFESAGHSARGLFRPQFACKMRDHSEPYCQVCNWIIGMQLAGMGNRPLQLFGTVDTGWPWTHMLTYIELPHLAPVGADLSRLLLYDTTTGRYDVFETEKLRSALAASPMRVPGLSIDAFWTTLQPCTLGLRPHVFAHSPASARCVIYEITNPDGAPALEARYDVAVPWTHMATFESRGQLHLVGYNTADGAMEIAAVQVPDTYGIPYTTRVVYGTSLDPTSRWATGYTLLTPCVMASVPHLIKHNATSGEVHIQSMDPPGQGPHTFISKPGHWNPGATTAFAFTMLDNHQRTYLLRSSLLSYLSQDWIWPNGAGVEPMHRQDQLDITAGLSFWQEVEGSGPVSGAHEVIVLELGTGRLRFHAGR